MAAQHDMRQRLAAKVLQHSVRCTDVAHHSQGHCKAPLLPTRHPAAELLAEGKSIVAIGLGVEKQHPTFLRMLCLGFKVSPHTEMPAVLLLNGVAHNVHVDLDSFAVAAAGPTAVAVWRTRSWDALAPQVGDFQRPRSFTELHLCVWRLQLLHNAHTAFGDVFIALHHFHLVANNNEVEGVAVVEQAAPAATAVVLCTGCSTAAPKEPRVACITL
mmetsp:Transcript_42454/g.98358  ORF Transcript_42454/g.98358 Transcript_42454/m.98358 type:complete len:215 (-) Transcript_42454:136-780(-)